MEGPPVDQVPSLPGTLDDYKDNRFGSGTADDPYRHTTSEGNTFIWNTEEEKWNLQPQTLATQQTAYVFQKKEKKKKRKGPKKKKNKSIYIKGLPQDTTIDELQTFCSKAGLIKKDLISAEPKIKIYKTETGECAGDALVTFFRAESVSLALTILDGADFRAGVPVSIAEASFDHKASDEPERKSRPSKKLKIYNQKKELSWEDEGSTHVVLKHMFSPEEAKGDVNFYSELEAEIQEECERIGEVEKVKVFERNPEGAVVVIFTDIVSSEKCISKMDGRFFGGRKISAEYYDGWTNYFVPESREEAERRADQFGDWLEQE